MTKRTDGAWIPSHGRVAGSCARTALACNKWRRSCATIISNARSKRYTTARAAGEETTRSCIPSAALISRIKRDCRPVNRCTMSAGMALWLGWNGEGALILRGFPARVYIELSEIYCATAVLILCCRDCVIAPVRDSASKRPGVVRPHPKSQFQIGA